MFRELIDPQKFLKASPSLLRYYSAQPGHNCSAASLNPGDDDSVFDCSNFDVGPSNADIDSPGTPNWDTKYRDRVNRQVFMEDVSYTKILTREEEKKKKAAALAKSLLGGSTDENVDEEIEVGEVGEVKEEDQKSLSVGIVGAPNAGKSSLTNCLCLFDTPGLMLKKSGFPYSDIKIRNESAWSSSMMR